MTRKRPAPSSKASSRARHKPASPGPVRLYGMHAVQAALANPARRTLRLHATAAALARLDAPASCPVSVCAPGQLDRLVPEAPHQGLVLETLALQPADLEPLTVARRLVMLDQVTDPHNVGAIFRSALAFGCEGVIAQDRHCPPESGALAKAASGALEHLPWVRVTNLARCLERLAEAGFWRLGLTGEAEADLAEIDPPERGVLVLGAEGRGLRPNVAAHCDQQVRIGISAAVDSLNVSNAAAVALYALRP
ncbi:MAG: 23S rRNA (guanosine(2251)-2'-O)-methyltransferase RlmB [Rhodothalassiaceae bacterium]